MEMLLSRKNLCLCFLLIFPRLLFAGNCVHTALSEIYNYAVTTTIKNEKIIDLSVSLQDKTTGKIFAKIKVPINRHKRTSLLGVYDNCNSRSFITGHNEKAPVIDGDYGDIVVADFNFDGKEDFAIKVNMGGNAGPYYFYYVFKDDNFILDKTLSGQLMLFPDVIDNKNKQLLIEWNTEGYYFKRRTFQYLPLKKKWVVSVSNFIKTTQ